MSITAAQVKELRERTGAGMMECKKALVATNGDMEAAIEQLRKRGLAAADKKSGRVAAEGVIAVAENASGAALVEINCETDFVAKDDNFRAFAEEVGQLALGVDNVDALNEAGMSSGNSVAEASKQLVAKIGENIQVRRMAGLNAGNDSLVASYSHGGRIGVLVELAGGDEALGRDLAMHIAALNPPWRDVSDVPESVIQGEKDILIAQAQSSGKPAEIVEKMVSGRLRKHLEEITLTGQPFVKDSDQTVGQLLKSRGAEVRAFVRLEVGEGIEKKEEDFAAEVMEQVRGS